MITLAPIDLNRRLAQAVSRLMVSRVDGERARLSVPVLYPSGSGAAVEVVMNGDKCFVSDLAIGQAEADMQGAGSFYNHAASKAAERFSVGFDGMSIFAVWASLDRIESAIISVANASVTASSNAIFKAIDDKEKKRNAELFDRVATIFGKADVSKEEEIPGREAFWPAHNVVTLVDKRKAVFEYVTESQNSVAAKFMMFSDLSKSPFRYSLNSVVRNLDRMGAKGSMLADVSYIMPIAANDTAFRLRAAVP